MAQTLWDIYKRSTFCSLFDIDTKNSFFSFWRRFQIHWGRRVHNLPAARDADQAILQARGWWQHRRGQRPGHQQSRPYEGQSRVTELMSFMPTPNNNSRVSCMSRGAELPSPSRLWRKWLQIPALRGRRMTTPSGETRPETRTWRPRRGWSLMLCPIMSSQIPRTLISRSQPSRWLMKSQSWSVNLCQVGKWIAQWDAPYEAWYYYNSETGVSTWNKPRELETIEFTDPVPDIAAAKKKVQAAHKLKVNTIHNFLRISWSFSLLGTGNRVWGCKGSSRKCPSWTRQTRACSWSWSPSQSSWDSKPTTPQQSRELHKHLSLDSSQLIIHRSKPNLSSKLATRLASFRSYIWSEFQQANK